MNNNAVFLRTQVMKQFIRGIFSGRLKEMIDSIPVTLFPKQNSSYRCCIYKDRAIAKYRLMALLGMRIEEEVDESAPLASYVEEAEARRGASDGPALTLIDAACHSCPSGRHTVSNLCRGCLARHCESSCPKDAIGFYEGRAVIDSAKCVNCGKCREACPYNAVVYTPVPCESACPVGAIKRGDEGPAQIDYERCISCGRCKASCPFGAVSERSHLFEICSRLADESDAKPVALIAPSAAGQFPGSFDQLITALRKAGFSAVTEVAYGAEETAAEESRELSERLRERSPLASSCCPAYTEAVRLHLPSFAPFLSTAPTPMKAAAAWSNTQWPGSPLVFIGPCLAKRIEASRDSSADYVMTFEELAALFLAREIDVAECGESKADNPPVSSRQRLFARSGGVAAAVLEAAEGELCREPELLEIDGLDKKALMKLRLAAEGKIKVDFAEVMSCPGGCVCGPGTVADPRISRRKLEEYAHQDETSPVQEKLRA